MACFSQSSLPEHLLLLRDTQMYYVIRLACCRLSYEQQAIAG